MATLDHDDLDFDEQAQDENAQLDSYSANKSSTLSWHHASWPANIRVSLTLAASLLIAGVLLIVALSWWHKSYDQQIKQQTAITQQSQTRLRNSGQERLDIESNLPLLLQLQEKTVYGEEKRLEWIEQLRSIEKHWPGLKIQYTINPQIAITKASANNGVYVVAPAMLGVNGEKPREFGTFQTEMQLNLGLMHEGDALAVIDELQLARLGVFKVSKCSFTRAAGVQAECILTWLNMKLVDAAS